MGFEIQEYLWYNREVSSCHAEENAMFSIEIVINDEWVTPVYEHVHHGRCFYAFEQARVALLREIGFPNDELLAQGKVLVISGVTARYLREVKRGRVQATCENPVLNGRTLILTQRILNERGKVAVEARIESVFMDQNTRRGMHPPEDFARAFLDWPKG
jgi:YbgC/YbaW family acyl-CoA thioester hydrolase